MGVFDTQSPEPAVKPVDEERTLEIHPPGRPPEETVIVRTSISHNDEVWVTKQFSRMIASSPEMSMAARLLLAERLWLHRLLISWTLTSEGQPIALDPDLASNMRWEAICKLPPGEHNEIYAQIMAKQRRSLDRLRISSELYQAVQSRGTR